MAQEWKIINNSLHLLITHYVKGTLSNLHALCHLIIPKAFQGRDIVGILIIVNTAKSSKTG